MRRFAIGCGVLIATILFFFSQDLSRAVFWGDPTPWWRYLVSWSVGIGALALEVPAVVAVSKRYPIERANWPRRLALHAGAAIVFAASSLVFTAAIDAQIGFIGPLDVASFRTILSYLAILSAHNELVAYATIVAAVHGHRYYQRYQERRLHATRLEAELVRAQLATLKAQLQPHFLFNTLNAIMVLVRQQRGELAEDTLAKLSDLLRCVLDDVEAQEVPLRRELEHVRLYLDIEQLRFADRLHVEIAADGAVLDARVPHLGLQPIVENAVRHGIGGRASAGTITIHAARVAETLELVVTDDGPGLGAAAMAAGRGIGLANVRARLDQLYGAAARLIVENGAGAGARVTMVVPYRLAAPEEVHARADR